MCITNKPTNLPKEVWEVNIRGFFFYHIYIEKIFNMTPDLKSITEEIDRCDSMNVLNVWAEQDNIKS